MKTRSLASALLVFSILSLSPNAVARESITYQEFNKTLGKVHRAYLRKELTTVDKHREKFLEEYELLMNGVNSGNIRIVHQYQKDDLKLAEGYSVSLGTAWEGIKTKYGYSSEITTKKQLREKARAEGKTDLEALMDVMAIKSVDTHKELKASEQALEDIPKEDTSDEDHLNNVNLEGKVTLQTVSEILGGKSYSNEVYASESEIDKINEQVLEEEVKALDFELVEYIMDNYFKEKYAHKTLPKTPAFLVERTEEQRKADEAKKAEEVKLKASREEEKKRKLAEKIKSVKEEELKEISKKVSQIKAVRENVARFEINQLKEQDEIMAKPKPSREVRINAQDRLLEMDDDVIILSVPLY